MEIAILCSLNGHIAIVGRSPTFARVLAEGRVSSLYLDLYPSDSYQMGTNPGIGLIPDLPPIHAKVGLRPTNIATVACSRAALSAFGRVVVVG